MKVLFLLNRVQGARMKDIQGGEDNDDHLYGLLRLRRFGIDTDYLEVEEYLPRWLAAFLRKHVLNIYWIHAPLFFKFLSYDAVYASTAFGSQLLHTLYPFRKPKWIMLDFSLSGMLGTEKSLRQKLLAFMMERAAGIVTIDAHEQRVLTRRFPDMEGRIEFVRFSVDTDCFTPKHGREEAGCIFSPGRDPGRDFATLFEAARGLGARVVITARQKNIRSLLPLPPFVTRADLTNREYIDAFAKASIVVVPLDTRSGINNAMGTSTIVEAMACGKPVIATRTATTESYIEDGRTGILVPAQDPEALREAVRTLLADPHLRERLGAEARSFVELACSADGSARVLAAYLERVVEG